MNNRLLCFINVYQRKLLGERDGVLILVGRGEDVVGLDKRFSSKLSLVSDRFDFLRHLFILLILAPKQKV